MQSLCVPFPSNAPSPGLSTFAYTHTKPFLQAPVIYKAACWRLVSAVLSPINKARYFQINIILQVFSQTLSYLMFIKPGDGVEKVIISSLQIKMWKGGLSTWLDIPVKVAAWSSDTEMRGLAVWCCVFVTALRQPRQRNGRLSSLLPITHLSISDYWLQ